MTLATAAQSATWTFVDGDWYEGNVAILGPRSHAMWLGTSVFDGARWFEGVAPDLDRHAARVNASAIALGLKPTMSTDKIVGLTWDGLKKFDGKTAVYIRPMYWPSMAAIWACRPTRPRRVSAFASTNRR